MKILITENQLEKIMFRWLDKELSEGVKYKKVKGIVYFIRKRKRIAYVENGFFNIPNETFEQFMDIFSMNTGSYYPSEIIKAWLKDRYKVDLIVINYA